MKAEKLLKFKTTISSDSAREIDNFEKNFLFLSTGFLSFTLVFIKDIFKIAESECIFLLQLSWGSLIISIGLIMFTFLKSQWDCDKAWNYLDDQLTTLKIDEDDDLITKEAYLEIKYNINNRLSSSKKHLKNIRMLAICFFLIGLTLMAYFININFYNTKSNENEQTKTPAITTCKNATYKAAKSTITAKDSTSRSSH